MVKIGIFGKPNVGKSTLFKSITLLPVKIANYPFTTIEPIEGQGYLIIDCIEKYFNVKCTPSNGVCRYGKRFVPITLIDLPGLIKEAHKGKGLGNKFLDATKNVDLLINVIDISGSTDENGNPVPPGSYDPLPDFEWVIDELDMWFYEKVYKNLESFKKKKNNLKEFLFKVVSGLGIKKDHLELAIKKYNQNLWNIVEDKDELFKFVKILRRIGKPVIHAANKIDLNEGKKNYKRAINKYKDEIIIPTSAWAELGLRILNAEGKIEYIDEDDIEIKINDPHVEVFVEYVREFVLKEFENTGVQTLLRVGIFNVLNYIAVWPVGNINLKDNKGRVLPDVFLLPPKTKVKDLAKMIHNDLYTNFIKAIELKSKKYLDKEDYLNNNDVIHIITKK